MWDAKNLWNRKDCFCLDAALKSVPALTPIRNKMGAPGFGEFLSPYPEPLLFVLELTLSSPKITFALKVILLPLAGYGAADCRIV